MNKVILDLHITPELLIEGFINEFNHILAVNLKNNNIDIKDKNIPRELVHKSIKEAFEVKLKEVNKWKNV